MTERQKILDTFYFANGKCCAGCDWWRSLSSMSGECTRSAPVGGRDRFAMLGMVSISAPVDAGHLLTPREHACGEFKDEFDWTTLPLGYRKSVGAPI